MPAAQYRVVGDQAKVQGLLRKLRRFKTQGGTDASAGAAIATLLGGRVASYIEERNYVDRDYTAAFSALYSRFFHPPSRFCVRYHFFARTVDPQEIQGAVASDGYLGYLVLWPTDPPVIGRTAIAPSPHEGPGERFLLTPTLTTHINGDPFRIEASPFATKDFGVSACATVSTWLATEHLYATYSLPRSSTAQITAEATEETYQDGRALPQRNGLTPGGIARALSRLGYDPFVYDLQRTGQDWKPLGAIYGYLHSGIPVIMTCSLDGVYTHAVLVVGYEFDAARVERSASETSASILAGVTALIVQDDRYGPYVRMTNLESTDHALGGDFLYGEGSRIKHHGMAETLVVPLPRGIGALGIDAHNIGVSFLELWTAKAQFTPRLDFCARTYLAESNTLKMEAQHWKWASAESLRKTSLPHWVWVTEALPLPLETDSLNATPIARVLSDPTVLRDAGDARLLWAHIGDDVLIPPPRPTRRPSSGAVERRRLIL